MLWVCGILLCYLNAATSQHFSIPDAKIQAFTPKGFRVSIPDEPGIELFAFHGRVNAPLVYDLDAGIMSRDITRPKHGRWIFEDKDIRLKPGDVVYYWLYVIVDGLGYQKLDQRWIVPALEAIPGGSISEAEHTAGLYEVPEARLERLYPKGLRVSIPDEPGIELFAFHGRVNTPLNHDLEAGTISRDVTRSKNGRWIFEDTNIRLKTGDVIYYWIYVIVDRVGYQKLNQKWVVPDDSDSNSVSGSTTTPRLEQTETVSTEPGGTDTPAGDFSPLNFKLPEGMELVVIVKDGKLLIKKPLPAQVAFQDGHVPAIGYCKASHICLPSVVKTQT